jgi:hypothetical protein
MNTLLKIALFLGLTLRIAAGAVGMAPPYLTDAQLAKYPVIVIAKWEKAPFTPHFKENDSNIAMREIYTRLRILEVIRGDVKPGEVDLMTGWGIGWNKEGKELRTHTSSDLPGDLDDVTQPAIWFLQRKRSWDKTRKDEYLSISNYRAVQPIELKDFYVAMTSKDSEKLVPTLLSMERTFISQRVLRHLCGGIPPWPFDQGAHGNFYSRPKERGKVYREEAEQIWEFVKANPGKPRPISVAAYAELVGKECVNNMRALLDDGDPQVRLVAIGVLAKHRDRDSIGRFANAASGLTGRWESCLVLEELSTWDEAGLVPTFIRFLQNDEWAYQGEGGYQDLISPMVLAKRTLHSRTGHAFPFDVELAENAWEEANKLENKAERLRLLETLAPEGKAPIIATAVGLPSQERGEYLWKGIERLEEGERVILVRLRNHSSQPVTILRQPSAVFETWEGGSGGYRTDEVTKGGKQEFVTIKPNDIGRLAVRVSKAFLEAPIEKRRLVLSYLASKNVAGTGTFAGEIEVVIGKRFER